MSSILESRAIWSSTPPDRRTRLADHPTLLYSWWATCFAAVVILTRLCGRKTRSNKLFREDWIMFLALVPLFARMACVHIVLVYGTNNVTTNGVDYTAQEIRNRELGSKLVLAARIFYALFIWMSKWTVSEFLKRITIHLWRTSYEFVLHCIRVFLVATFIAVVIATLAECQPFSHYWQVVPDPGPQCRQNYAQLITMGTADIITDILLIAFPIPIVLRSGQNWKRKLQLASLFSTSIALIIITGMRVPEVISNLGRQQYRTVWASSEILASAFVSNIVVIGSFLRDKGTKKNKWKSTSVSDSIDRASQRRPTMAPSTGSEEDLFRNLGCRMPDYLQDNPLPVSRPAPVVLPSSGSLFADKDRRVDTPGLEAVEDSDGDVSPGHRSLHNYPLPSPSPSTGTGTSPRKNVSFFDVGGLLENGSTGTPSPSITHSRSVTIVSSGASHTIATDFATSMHTPPQSRRSSRAFLSDMGAILTPSTSRSDNSVYAQPNTGYVRRSSLPNSRLRNAAPPTGVLGPMLERQETQISLQDAGGLLSSSSPVASQNNVQYAGQPQELRDDDDESSDNFDLTSSHTSNNTRSTRLQDLGSFLASNRRTDLDSNNNNNIEMRRFDVRDTRLRGPPAPARTQRRSSNNNNNNRRSASSPIAGYESMNLHDPGGLLRR